MPNVYIKKKGTKPIVSDALIKKAMQKVFAKHCSIRSAAKEIGFLESPAHHHRASPEHHRTPPTSTLFIEYSEYLCSLSTLRTSAH